MYSKISPAEYGRLMEAAKLRARHLRRQAIREFGSGTGRAAARALQAARRRASRLLRRATPQRQQEV